MDEIEVRLKGQLDESWSDWLGGLAIAHTENGETVLTGSVRDQSALLGLLNKMSALGLRVISVALRDSLPHGHKEAPKM